MKVFIEDEAGTNKKNIFNEKTLEYKKTVTISRNYPYPYGFVLGTTSGDGDNLDCFIITSHLLKVGTIMDVKPIGMFEQIEDGKEDSNILAVLKDENIKIDEEVKQKLREFVEHVFDHLKDKNIEVGDFFGKETASRLIQKCADKSE